MTLAHLVMTILNRYQVENLIKYPLLSHMRGGEGNVTLLTTTATSRAPENWFPNSWPRCRRTRESYFLFVLFFSAQANTRGAVIVTAAVATVLLLRNAVLTVILSWVTKVSRIGRIFWAFWEMIELCQKVKCKPGVTDFQLALQPRRVTEPSVTKVNIKTFVWLVIDLSRMFPKLISDGLFP